MFDLAANSRFASAYADAVVGYSSAFVAAWSQVAIRSVERSASVVEAFSADQIPGATAPRGTTPFSYNEQSLHPSFPAVFKASAEMFMPPSAASSGNMFAASTELAEAWMNLWMRQSTTIGARNAFALWPSVFTMMSFGMPKDIAVPMAEANAASVEAAQAATAAFNSAFSAYRGEGGHASAHLIAPIVALMTSVAMPGAGATLCPPGRSPARRGKSFN